MLVKDDAWWRQDPTAVTQHHKHLGFGHTRGPSSPVLGDVSELQSRAVPLLFTEVSACRGRAGLPSSGQCNATRASPLNAEHEFSSPRRAACQQAAALTLSSWSWPSGSQHPSTLTGLTCLLPRAASQPGDKLHPGFLSNGFSCPQSRASSSEHHGSPRSAQHHQCSLASSRSVWGCCPKKTAWQCGWSVYSSVKQKGTCNSLQQLFLLREPKCGGRISAGV